MFNANSFWDETANTVVSFLQKKKQKSMIFSKCCLHIFNFFLTDYRKNEQKERSRGACHRMPSKSQCLKGAIPYPPYKIAGTYRIF